METRFALTTASSTATSTTPRSPFIYRVLGEANPAAAAVGDAPSICVTPQPVGGFEAFRNMVCKHLNFLRRQLISAPSVCGSEVWWRASASVPSSVCRARLDKYDLSDCGLGDCGLGDCGLDECGLGGWADVREGVGWSGVACITG